MYKCFIMNGHKYSNFQLKENVDVVQAMCMLNNFLTETMEYSDMNTLIVDEKGIAVISASNVLNLAHLRGYQAAKELFKQETCTKIISTANKDPFIGS